MGLPSKISLFMWNSYLDKIPTLIYLKTRSLNLENTCVLCTKEEELVDHIFIHCLMARKMWDFDESEWFMFWREIICFALLWFTCLVNAFLVLLVLFFLFFINKVQVFEIRCCCCFKTRDVWRQIQV